MKQTHDPAPADDRFLACCHCKALIQDAVQLRCLHNCCQRCFSSLACKGHEEEVACGWCGVTTLIGTERPNNFIECQVQHYRSIAESRICGTCRENGVPDKLALMWCSTCRHSLCEDCEILHGNFFRQHKTRSLEVLGSFDKVCAEPSASTCPIHNELQHVACLCCEKTKCVTCVAECIMKSHPVLYVDQEPFNNHVDKLVADIQSMESELLLKSEVLKMPGNALRDVKATRYRHLEEIYQRKRRILDAVEQAYCDIVWSTTKAYDELQKEGCNATAAADCIAFNLSEARRYVALLIESNDRAEIFNQQKVVLERMTLLSADVDALSDKLATTNRVVKIEGSLPNDVDRYVKAWIGMPEYLYSDLLDSETLKSSTSYKTSRALDLPEDEMNQLISIVTPEMNKVTDKYGQFAYYFDGNMEMEAFVTAETRCTAAVLQTELAKLLCGHMPQQHVRVTVNQNPPVAFLCCGGIGSILNVGRMEQMVGLYVQYQGRGTIYWISAAHGLIKCSSTLPFSNQAAHHMDALVASRMHVNNRPRITARFSACPDLNVVDMPAPYVALSYNPVPLRCDTQDWLCHSVDIMMGPTPLTDQHISNYLPCKSSFVCATDGCCQPICSSRGHAVGQPLYTISSIRYFDAVSSDGCTTFKMQDLIGENVCCYLGEERQLATGRVDSVYNRTPTTTTRHENATVYLAQNMLRIVPTGRCMPAEGHSGSVWVRRLAETGQYEAIAITCAVILPCHQPSTLQSACDEAWLASPLCACLLAISNEYPERFSNYKEFKVLN